jgi:hypothetical protein
VTTLLDSMRARFKAPGVQLVTSVRNLDVTTCVELFQGQQYRHVIAGDFEATRCGLGLATMAPETWSMPTRTCGLCAVSS